MTISKVSIRFTSLNNLWAFRLDISAYEFSMNMAELTLTCQCSAEHIQLAKEKYNGKVVGHVREEA